MTHATVRATILSQMASLVPSTRQIGMGRRYVELRRDTAEEQTEDRAFSLVAVQREVDGLASKPEPQRWHTTFQLAISYRMGPSLDDDERRIGEDYEQIAAMIDDLRGQSDDIWCIVPESEHRHLATTIDGVTVFTFTVYHK